MTRADYRAEARAWRRRARALHPDWGYAIAPFPDSHGVRADMHKRAVQHEYGHLSHYHPTLCDGVHLSPQEFYTHRVLACLLLALEAEDDARRAER